MDLFAILFYLFALLTVGSALVMAFSRKIVRSAFALMFALIGVAALYILLYADFVAATQLMIYVGGILILILFGVMLTAEEFTFRLKTITVNMVPATILSASVGVLLLYVFYTSEWAIVEQTDLDQTVTDLGHLLLNEYLLPFQAAGALLLVAIIGALLMATRDQDQQNNDQQNKTDELWK